MKIRTLLRSALVVLCILPAATGCSRIDDTDAQSVVITSADSLSADMEFDDSQYVFSTLDDKEKEYYQLIRDAAMNFETVVDFPEPVEPDTLRKLFIAVYYQEEELFWMNSMFFRPSEAATTLQLTYRFSRDEVSQMQSELDAATAKIFAQFDENTSDYEKLRVFHDTLVLGCEFSQERPYVNTTYGALVDGYVQCEGYAFAFDYLCKLADIDCFTMSSLTMENGYTHAWNIVKLEDMWYHVDCTWDDPVLDEPDPEFLRHYYFLADDSGLINMTHTPDNTYFVQPQCISSQNFYKREELYTEKGDNAAELMIKAADIALDKGIVNFGIKFADKRSFDKAYSDLFDGKQIGKVIEYVNADGRISVEEKKYKRYSNEDEFIIHVSLFRK